MAQPPSVPLGGSPRWRALALAGAVVGLAAAVWMNRESIQYLLTSGKSGRISRRDAEPSCVDDAAELLGPFRETLNRQAAGFSRDLGIDLRVVTVRGAGEDVSSLAERLFRERGVGSAAPTGGVLLVLDPTRSQARIEVSYSLEHVYPDAVVARLIRDQLVPYASYHMVGMGVMDVLHFLRGRAFDAVASGDLTLPDSLRDRPVVRDFLAGRSAGAGAQSGLVNLSADSDLKRTIPPEQRAQYAPSADPMESAEAYARVLRDAAGDPTLDLFTRRTRVMRLRGPVAPYEDRHRWEVLEASRPWRVVVQEPLAVVRSDTPARGFVPILMVRDEGLWRVDLVETWKNLFFAADGNYFVRNALNYYVFGLNVPAQAERDASVLPVDLYGEDIAAAVARLDRASAEGGGARIQVRFADILYRNCWLVVEAMAHYERAAALAPTDWTIAKTIADRASYLGFPLYAIGFLEPFGPRANLRIAQLYLQGQKPKLAEKYYRLALEWEPDKEKAQEGLEWLAKPTHAEGVR
jgi:hypothetical protein